MEDLIRTESIRIENMIYVVRGKQVMLDSDLAILYGTEVKRINESVSRNSEKFPERFYFRISDEEVSKLFIKKVHEKLNEM